MIETKINEIFNHIHQNAELSNEEVKTTDYIYDFLKSEGFEPVKFKNITGLYCDMGNWSGDYPLIGMRADIDALYQEVNGRLQANHSCGHDSHISMVIGAMLKLKDHEALKTRGVRFVFQPAEELGTGALDVLKEGVIDPLDYMFGIHLRPIEEARDGFISPSIEHGSAGSFEFRISGHDAHGARPHLNSNAIEVGSAIVNMLSKIHINPMVPTSAKMTKFMAGSKSLNIIPGSAECGIDVRAQTNSAMKELKENIHNILRVVEELYDVKIENLEESSIVASESNEDAIAVFRSAIIDTVGEEHLLEPIVTSGGDDFHNYTVQYPDLKGAMLGLGCDLTPGLHHPDMTFNHERMQTGANVLYQTILNVPAK